MSGGIHVASFLWQSSTCNDCKNVDVNYKTNRGGKGGINKDITRLFFLGNLCGNPRTHPNRIVLPHLYQAGANVICIHISIVWLPLGKHHRWLAVWQVQWSCRVVNVMHLGRTNDAGIAFCYIHLWTGYCDWIVRIGTWISGYRCEKTLTLYVKSAKWRL